MKSHLLLLDGFMEFRKGCGISEKTRVVTFYQIRKFLSWISDEDIRSVTRERIFEYKSHLENHKSDFSGKVLSEVTIRSEMSKLKSFFNYLQNSELILKNPLEGVSIRTREGQKLRAVFTEVDIITFLDSISVRTPAGLRDRTLYELMYSSGLRVNEILNLEIEHVNLDERILLIKQGKGKKDRYVPFCETALQFLIRYITKVRKEKKKRIHYLFRGEVGQLNYGKLRDRFVSYIHSCDLDGKGYTMHSIRHATGTHLLIHGASIRYVQELLGHEDLKTTQLYTRPSEDNIRKVYRTYHPRENEYHREISPEYLKHLDELKMRILWGKRRSEHYRRYGHTRGFGRWKGKVS